MTEFKRTTQAIEEIEGLVQVLLSGGEAEEVQRLGKLVGDTGPVVEKLSRKAAETDPHKQTYGPGMREKIRVMAEKWLSVDSLARDVLAQRGGSVAEPSEPGPAPPPPRPPSTGSVLWQPPQSATAVPATASTSSSPQHRSAGGGVSGGQSTPASNEERRRLAAAAAEARMGGGTSSSGGKDSSNGAAESASTSLAATSALSAQQQPQSGAASSSQPLPLVARMDALLHLVHCVFVGHGFSKVDDGSVFAGTDGPLRLQYRHDQEPSICVTYLPVQRYLITYVSIEGLEATPAKASVQVGMPAAAVQAKIDYLLVYPILYRKCLPTLESVPNEPLFMFFCGLSIPSLAAAGCTSRSISVAIFDDDILWYRIVMSLPQSPQLSQALESAKKAQERGEALPRGAYRLMARTEVKRARTEAEEMRRRREEAELMRRQMRDPLMVQPPRRPGVPGFPGGLGIGGPNDLFPGGGFGPLGGGRRDPFGGRGGFGGGGFGGGIF
eukprot:TRINITY_DN79638_c0_g1_i1.p1 TRINITY_DN79638_c0_g1~~TRINITY_DN79638_c0_g1_i1.p1  ORF type:complete len:497 (-),score=101.11 TRINITY_DN79638_c0_g1_i1:7-1497(-)